MPKVIIGEYARLKSEADKLVRREENFWIQKLYLGKRARKLTNKQIAKLTGLTEQTVGRVFSDPLHCRVENVAICLTAMGVRAGDTEVMR